VSSRNLITADRPLVEGLPIVSFDQSPGATRIVDPAIVINQVDQDGVQRHVAVVVELADRDSQPVCQVRLLLVEDDTLGADQSTGSVWRRWSPRMP
jgi:hypothetical protein